MNMLEGERLPENLLNKVRHQLTEAILKKRFYFLIKDKNVIGFYTLQEGWGKVLINNLYIPICYRNRNNLLHLRKMFKNKYGTLEHIYWKNRNKNKYFNCGNQLGE